MGETGQGRASPRGTVSLPPTAPAVMRSGLPQFFMEVTEAVSGVDVGRLEVQDRDLPGSPNWAARFTILEGDPNGQFTIRTDPKTNEGVLSVVKVSGGPRVGHPWKELDAGGAGSAGALGSGHTDPWHPHSLCVVCGAVPLRVAMCVDTEHTCVSLGEELAHAQGHRYIQILKHEELYCRAGQQSAKSSVLRKFQVCSVTLGYARDSLGSAGIIFI